MVVLPLLLLVLEAVGRDKDDKAGVLNVDKVDRVVAIGIEVDRDRVDTRGETRLEAREGTGAAGATGRRGSCSSGSSSGVTETTGTGRGDGARGVGTGRGDGSTPVRS